MLDVLGRSHELGNVFIDFLTMGICAYHRINIRSGLQEKDPGNESIYMNIIKKYDQEAINTFPKILGELHLQVLKHPYSDILGEYYMQNITNGRNGQYFTPEPLCDMMARLQYSTNIEHKTVLDPACGSGRLLLSFAKANPNNYFFGADSNNTCAKMSALNFFLNGLKGEVAWMDSLSMEWFGGWHINTNGLGIIPIEREQSRIWCSEPGKPADEYGTLKIENAAQLNLFSEP